MVLFLQFIRVHIVWELLLFISVCLWIAGRSQFRATVLIAQVFALMLIVFWIAEVSLRLIDPWGGWAYQQNLAAHRRQTLPHTTRGYTLKDGTITWADGSAATTVGGGRHTPARQDRPCSIVALGDSVTFGFGVRDEAVYVNRLAQRFPGVSWNNASVTGYDHPSLRAVYEETPADGYLYLLIDNDLQAPGMVWWATDWPRSRPASALRVYGEIAIGRIEGDPRPVAPLAWENLSFVEDPTVLAFVPDFDQPSLREAQGVYGDDLIVIPGWTETVSFADGHPSAAGHAELAASMEPYVEEWLPIVCGAAGQVEEKTIHAAH